MTDSLIPAEAVAAQDGSRRARIIALVFGIVLLTFMVIQMAQPRPVSEADEATPPSATDTQAAPTE